MNFSQLIKERFSLRKFDSRVIEKEKLDMVLEAGRLAPTACNNQPQRVLVINNEEGILKLRECTRYCFNASVFLLVCYDKTVSWVRNHDCKNSGDVDASIVATHMMMQAAELGLGTTWVGHFDPEAISKAFSLSENLVPVVLLPIGYPADIATASPLHEKRYPIEETVSYNEFSKKTQKTAPTKNNGQEKCSIIFLWSVLLKAKKKRQSLCCMQDSKNKQWEHLTLNI